MVYEQLEMRTANDCMNQIFCINFRSFNARWCTLQYSFFFFPFEIVHDAYFFNDIVAIVCWFLFFMLLSHCYSLYRTRLNHICWPPDHRLFSNSNGNMKNAPKDLLLCRVLLNFFISFSAYVEEAEKTTEQKIISIKLNDPVAVE